MINSILSGVSCKADIFTSTGNYPFCLDSKDLSYLPCLRPKAEANYGKMKVIVYVKKLFQNRLA
jgi:hypothetical protein